MQCKVRVFLNVLKDHQTFSIVIIFNGKTFRYSYFFGDLQCSVVFFKQSSLISQIFLQSYKHLELNNKSFVSFEMHLTHAADIKQMFSFHYKKNKPGKQNEIWCILFDVRCPTLFEKSVKTLEKIISVKYVCLASPTFDAF